MADTVQITVLLQKLTRGDTLAHDELTPLVYAELKRMARRHLSRERSDHTLQATALIHEAFLKLVDQKQMVWQNRAHFFAVASQIMRRILVDHARQRNAQRRGGPAVKVQLEESLMVSDDQCDLVEHLHEAMERLAAFDPRQAQIVELRFFGGLTEDEIAEVLRVSSRTVKRDWVMAKAWLHGELKS